MQESAGDQGIAGTMIYRALALVRNHQFPASYSAVRRFCSATKLLGLPWSLPLGPTNVL